MVLRNIGSLPLILHGVTTHKTSTSSGFHVSSMSCISRELTRLEKKIQNKSEIHVFSTCISYSFAYLIVLGVRHIL
jgi:hypothetical protein